MVGLVGTVLGETKVVGLLGGHGSELDAELTEMGSGNLLVERLGEHAKCCQLECPIYGWNQLTGHLGGRPRRWSRERSGPRSDWRTNKT